MIRGRKLAALAALAWGAALFSLSAQPLSGNSLDFAWRFTHDDKLVHFALYAPLGGLLRLAVGRWWLAVVLAGSVGLIDEFVVQARIPAREADPLDVAADVLGAAMGAWLVVRSGWARGARATARRGLK